MNRWRDGHQPDGRNHCEVCSLRWPCPWIEVCEELEGAETFVRELAGMLSTIVRAQLPSSDQGQFCVHCDWFHEDFFVPAVHGEDCVLVRALAALVRPDVAALLGVAGEEVTG